MNRRTAHLIGFLNSGLNGLFWTLLFAVAYAQSPLYTSNQNQYFLHGYARGGFGHLAQDWLANTLDPTPVFSKLVELTLVYLPWSPIFYAIYALLMGIYMYSLYHLADELIRIKTSRIFALILLAAMIAIHSAALRYVLSRSLGANWTYLLEDGVADQRMLGPVLQPSSFGVFLLFSLLLFVQRKPIMAVLAAVLAATFHPTYLFSAMLLTLAYTLFSYRETKSLWQPAMIGAAALVSVLPIAWYVYTSFSGSSPEAAAQARQILINYRIPHHAIIIQWLDLTVVVKILITGAALAWLWPRKTQPDHLSDHPDILHARRRLWFVLVFISAAALLLTLLQLIVESDVLALLFPWRISILILPVAVLVLLCGVLQAGMKSRVFHSRRLRDLIRLGATFVIFGAVLIGAIRFKLDLDRKAAEAEEAVLGYVYAHSAADEVYLTPVKMQDFRLESGAPAFVDFKSIPYRDGDVLEWYRRERLADRFYQSGECDLIPQFRQDGGVTHAVLEVGSPAAACPGLRIIHRDDAYLLAEFTP